MAKQEPPSFWLHFTAGGLAGTIGAAVTCPLEVVKTRLQSSLYIEKSNSALKISFNNPVRAIGTHIHGVVSILHDIYKAEGVRALWKGLGPNLIGVVPARSIYFSVYTQNKHFLSERFNNGIESPGIHMLSASGASGTTALVTNPIWLVKTRMQLQSHGVDAIRYRNSLHCAWVVCRTEGLPALYKGFSASLLGLSESALQFVTYEALKKWRRESREKAYHQNTNADNNPLQFTTKLPYVDKPSIKRAIVILDYLEFFGCAAVAKLGATLVTYPHEVIRTRLRQSPDSLGKVKYTGLIASTKMILAEEGITAFYGGMTAHIMRVVPNAALLFISYEVIVRWWQNKSH